MYINIPIEYIIVILNAVSDTQFDTKMNADILLFTCYIIIIFYKDNFISLKCMYEYAYFY